jgi:hypothetical protein
LPQNAFTQIANDLAVSLNLPLFISNSKKNPADIKSFLHRLRLAGKMASQLSSDGLVVVIIDAADNSIAAAAEASIPEQTFIHELAASNLSELPSNVRIIVSSRTARRVGLQLPEGTVEVPCGVFTPTETAEHLSINSLTAKQAKVEHFHSLTGDQPS